MNLPTKLAITGIGVAVLMLLAFLTPAPELAEIASCHGRDVVGGACGWRCGPKCGWGRGRSGRLRIADLPRYARQPICLAWRILRDRLYDLRR